MEDPIIKIIRESTCGRCGANCVHCDCWIDSLPIYSEIEWHKYPDEKPEEYEYCLVYAHRKGTGEPCPISIASYFKEVWSMLNYDEPNAVSCGDISDHMTGSEVTHWAYMPKGPIL